MTQTTNDWFETNDAGTTVSTKQSADGIHRVWSENGVLIQAAEIDEGQYHGRYASWWENGERREEGRFYRGKRVGLYRWFSERGTLLKEEDYGPGAL